MLATDKLNEKIAKIAVQRTPEIPNVQFSGARAKAVAHIRGGYQAKEAVEQSVRGVGLLSPWGENSTRWSQRSLGGLYATVWQHFSANICGSNYVMELFTKVGSCSSYAMVLARIIGFFLINRELLLMDDCFSSASAQDSAYLAENKMALMKSSNERAPEFDCDSGKMDSVTRVSREYTRMKSLLPHYDLFWEWAHDWWFARKAAFEKGYQMRNFIQKQKQLRSTGGAGAVSVHLRGMDLDNPSDAHREHLAALAALPSAEDLTRWRQRDQNKLLVFGAGPHDVAGFTDRPAPINLNLETGAADASEFLQYLCDDLRYFGQFLWVRDHFFRKGRLKDHQVRPC